METVGSPKNSGFETQRTYRIEHFPSLQNSQLDAVVNLDYPEQPDCNDILEIIRKSKFGKYFDMDKLSSEIYSIEDSKGQKFFIKTKHQTADPISGKLVDLIKNPASGDVVDDFKNKKARYGLAGVLNEIILVKKIKEIIISNKAQELARRYGFSGIKFSEPIIALIDKEHYRKCLIYRNLKKENMPFPGNNSQNFADELREIFLQNNVSPNDLKENQFVVVQEDGKYYIVLIDTEAYFETEN
jgi:hypothetical protein